MDSQDSPQSELRESHHLPSYDILYDQPQGLHPNVIFPGTPKLGISKFSKFELSTFWKPITSYENLQLQ
jgi:hypothetical protein